MWAVMAEIPEDVIYNLPNSPNVAVMKSESCSSFSNFLSRKIRN